MRIASRVIAAFASISAAFSLAPLPSLAQGPAGTTCEDITADLAKKKTFNTTSPQTTFFSAFFEGAIKNPEPETPGQSYTERLRKLTIPPMEERIVRQQPNPPPHYCATFQASRDTLIAAMANAFRSIEYPVEEADRRRGVFSTKFVDRKVSGRIWMDRYRLTLESGPSGGFVVRVNRQVYTSREQDMYYQGISNGKNEAWILSQISAQLPPL